MATALITVSLGQAITPEATATAAVQSDKSFTVLYTSKLLGYIRSDDQSNISPLTITTAQTVTDKFLANVNAAKDSNANAILLGMGDNLAPQYLARFQDGRPKERAGSGPITDDHTLAIFGKLYDALVPGKEDFYFGPARLKRIAETLHQLNAANLSISATYATPPVDPNEPVRLGFINSHPHISFFDDGHLVLKRANEKKPTYSVEFDNSEITKSTPSLWVCDVEATSRCLDPIKEFKAFSEADSKKTVVTYDLSTITNSIPSGSRRLLCFNNISRPNDLSEKDWERHGKRLCHEVMVDERLFHNFPYISITRPSAAFAIFGIVGTDVRDQIQLFNRTWLSNSKVKIEVSFWNPTKAVQQAIYECRFNGDCNANTNLILMAQTTAQDAENISRNLAKLGIKLTLTKAEAVESAFGASMDYSAAGHAVPVIGTRSIYLPTLRCSANDTKATAVLRNPLHVVVVHENGIVDHAQTPKGTADWCVSLNSDEPGKSNLDQIVQKSPWHAKDIEHFAVEQMREQFHADAAMLYEHSIFRDSGIAKETSLGEQSERVIWDGAHIFTLRLSGKKLRETLEASKKAEDDRYLIYSGIEPSDDKNYYINGHPLVDTSYYTVIAPGSLVHGEPLYSSLSDETFERPEPHEQTVAQFVCSIIRASHPEDHYECLRSVPNSLSDSQADTTLDVLSYPPKPRIWDYVLSIVAPHHHDPLIELNNKCRDSKGTIIDYDSCTQVGAQLRPLLFATLEKNAISYSLSKAHPNDTTASGEFGGVTDPRVVKAHTEVFSIDHDLRIGYSWQRYNVGIEESIQFGRSRQGNTPGEPDSVSLTANKAMIGPFFEWALLHNSAPNWRLVVRPVDYSSNLSRTVATVQGANDSAGNPTFFTESLAAQRSIAPKVGFRFEAPQRKDSLYGSEGNSFFEAGYNSTWSLNIPAELTLNPGTPVPTSCSLLAASQTLANCAKTIIAMQPRVIVTRTESNNQNGAYWTTLFRFPIAKWLTYKIGSDGEWNRESNNSIETRYAVTIDNYFQTRIWGNLSVAPHAGWFFYQNQASGNNLIRHSIDVTLMYNFNWHAGMSWHSFIMKPATSQ